MPREQGILSYRIAVPLASLVVSIVACAGQDEPAATSGGPGIVRAEEVGPLEPPTKASVVGGGDSIGDALVVAVEWPDQSGQSVDRWYIDEAAIDWPEAILASEEWFLRVETATMPELVEYWFYNRRLESGLPDGEAGLAGTCDPLDNPGCARRGAGSSVEIPLPSVRAEGLLIVQVEWRTDPGSGEPLVARVSWAIEVRD